MSDENAPKLDRALVHAARVQSGSIATGQCLVWAGFGLFPGIFSGVGTVHGYHIGTRAPSMLWSDDVERHARNSDPPWVV